MTWITSLFSFFKNRKILSYGLGIVGAIFTIIISWNSITDNYYEEGYQDAKQEYQAELIRQQNENTDYLNTRLQQLRENLQAQNKRELERIRSEQETDIEVQTITEYIKEKVYVQDTCDVVPTDLNSMFNNSIRTINGKEGR